MVATRLTELLGVQHPIMAAGMAGVSRWPKSWRPSAKPTDAAGWEPVI